MGNPGPESVAPRDSCQRRREFGEERKVAVQDAALCGEVTPDKGTRIRSRSFSLLRKE